MNCSGNWFGRVPMMYDFVPYCLMLYLAEFLIAYLWGRLNMNPLILYLTIFTPDVDHSTIAGQCKIITFNSFKCKCKQSLWCCLSLMFWQFVQFSPGLTLISSIALTVRYHFPYSTITRAMFWERFCLVYFFQCKQWNLIPAGCGPNSSDNVYLHHAFYDYTVSVNGFILFSLTCDFVYVSYEHHAVRIAFI